MFILLKYSQSLQIEGIKERNNSPSNFSSVICFFCFAGPSNSILYCVAAIFDWFTCLSCSFIIFTVAALLCPYYCIFYSTSLFLHCFKCCIAIVASFFFKDMNLIFIFIHIAMNTCSTV